MTVKELCEYLQSNYDENDQVVCEYIDMFHHSHRRRLLKESLKRNNNLCVINATY